MLLQKIGKPTVMFSFKKFISKRLSNILKGVWRFGIRECGVLMTGMKNHATALLQQKRSWVRISGSEIPCVLLYRKTVQQERNDILKPPADNFLRP
jgi:hypothetical protein